MWIGRVIIVWTLFMVIVGCTGEAPEKPTAGKTLPSKHSTQGTPPDSKIQGKGPSSGPLRTRNSAPTVTSVSIEPELPRKNSTLKARIEASDPDGDTISFSYQWVKNGDELIGETSETLVDPTLKKGDRIVIRVSPYDMENTGKEATSQEIVILNSAPVITSSPKAQKMKSSLYTYQVVAEDPDGDSITFSLSPSSPQGMAIDPRTGLIQWKVGRDGAGTHTIEIIAADDDEGRCTQKYSLTIRMPKS